MSITTLFVDIGGVFLTNGWEQQSRKLAAKQFQLDFEQIESRHRLLAPLFEIGKLSMDQYLQAAIFFEQRPFSKEQFKEFMYAQSEPYPLMIQLFQKLKEQHGWKMVAVNNESLELNQYRIKRFKLDQFIDFFVSSCIVQLLKPDLELFRLALDLSQSTPEETLYLDDRALYTQVAQTLGIQVLHHVDYAATKQFFTTLGQ
jgi:putative hydrolase of the HAD superfamily